MNGEMSRADDATRTERVQPQPGAATAGFMLTRFNLRIKEWIGKYGSRWRGADEDYLSRRMELFEKYTLPSMMAQTVKCPWLVFLSELTPPEFRRRFDELHRRFPALIPIYLADREPMLEREEMGEAMRNEVLSRCGETVKRIVTMRIDNDDAINPDYCRTVMTAAAADTGEATLIVLPVGCAYNESRRILQRWVNPKNHFTALACARGNFRHIFSFSHMKMPKDCGRIELPLENAWLEIVHGSNAVNFFRCWNRPIVFGGDKIARQFGVKIDVSRTRGAVHYLLVYLPALPIRVLHRFGKALKRRLRNVGNRA